MLKGLVHQEVIKNLNISVPHNKIHKAKTNKTTEVDKSTTVGNLNIPFSVGDRTNRKSVKTKITNNRINQLDLIFIEHPT